MRIAARLLLATAATLAFSGAFSGVAHADAAPADTDWNAAGHFNIKLLGTAVLPLGHLVKNNPVLNDTANLVGSGAITSVAASDNYVPTVAIEYFVNKNISIETICCMTGHHVSATGGTLAGKELIHNIQIIPATFTLKWHFTGLSRKFVPYIGAGPSVFLIVADRPSDFVKANTPVTRTKLTTEPTVAIQAGIDAPINQHWSISIDAKKYFDKTTAHFWAGSTQVEAVRVNLMPFVVSAGIGYRF